MSIDDRRLAALRDDARRRGALVVPVEIDAADAGAGERAAVAPGLDGEIAGWRDGERVTVNVATGDLDAWLRRRLRP